MDSAGSGTQFARIVVCLTTDIRLVAVGGCEDGAKFKHDGGILGGGISKS